MQSSDSPSGEGSSSLDTRESCSSSSDNKRLKSDSPLHLILGDEGRRLLSEQQAQSTTPTNSTTTLQSTYSKATPFPHAHVKDLFQSDFLLSVKEEIKRQTNVHFKESDLFRVYQSIDLANVKVGSDLATQLPNVVKLRDALYSQEWKSFMERITGLPPSTLTEQIDSAFNCHAPGCHLLCHDDVIGTRKISYIIYLTEDDWLPEEGGSLELYEPQLDSPASTTPSSPNKKKRAQEDNELSTSLPLPTTRVWPTFNSMAFFSVEPGVSYHAVQEVLGDRPRLSLQGWYHAAEPPKNMELATLQQLKSTNTTTSPTDDAQQQQHQRPLLTTFENEENAALTKDDRAYLAKYIKHEYLTDASMTTIQKQFEQNSSIQLRDFLLDKWIPKLDHNPSKKKKEKAKNQGNSCGDESATAYYEMGVSAEWTLRGPAHKQRYLEFQPDAERAENSQVIGGLLNHVKTKVFQSEAMARYLHNLTEIGKPTGVLSGEVRRFRPGLDYTVAHYGLMVQESVLDATLCFVSDDEQEDKEAWESGDCGGFECYIEADDNDDDEGDGPPRGAADEYNGDDDDETALLSVNASNNTLSLVYRDPGTLRFVKYVGSSAPSSRYDICIEYDVPRDDDDEEQEDEREHEES